MNPFLEIPVIVTSVRTETERKLFSTETKRIETHEVVTGRILPGEISYHRPDGKNTLIILRNGAWVYTTLTSQQIDRARVLYEQAMKADQKRTENLCIVFDEKPEPKAEPTQLKAEKGGKL